MVESLEAMDGFGIESAQCTTIPRYNMTLRIKIITSLCAPAHAMLKHIKVRVRGKYWSKKVAFILLKKLSRFLDKFSSTALVQSNI